MAEKFAGKRKLAPQVQQRLAEMADEMTTWLSQQPQVTHNVVDDDPRRFVQKAITYPPNNIPMSCTLRTNVELTR